MQNMNNKQRYLKELEKLDEIVLYRLVELAKNPKAIAKIKDPYWFSLLKSFL